MKAGQPSTVHVYDIDCKLLSALKQLGIYFNVFSAYKMTV